MKRLLAGMMMLGAMLAACGSSGDSQGNTCNFPQVLEQHGSDTVFQCGDGSVLECREGGCVSAGGAAGGGGSPNSGNTTDSGNPVDSGNRTTNNVNPTPTPDRGLGR